MKSGETFTLFADLPLDIRLLIWEAALPPPGNLKIGAIVNHIDDGEGNVVELTAPCYDTTALGPGKPPSGMLGTCRDSRQVALSSGTFFQSLVQEIAVTATWVPKFITNVYLDVSKDGVPDTLVSIPGKVDAVTCLWPTIDDLSILRKALRQRDKQQKQYEAVQTVYMGISAVIYNPDDLQPDSDSGNDLYIYPDEAQFTVLPLNDPQVPPIVELCFHDTKHNRQLHHRRPECYLRTLNRFWDITEAGNGLRRAWALGAWGDTKRPELVPVILFGRTKQALWFSKRRRNLEKERMAGIIFGNDHVPDNSGYMPWYAARTRWGYKCEQYCPQ